MRRDATAAVAARRRGSSCGRLQLLDLRSLGGGAGVEKIVNENGNLCAYNQKRNFHCYLDPKALDGVDFMAILKEKGVGGCKAYCWAFMEEGRRDTLVVITNPVLPAQPW